MAEPAIMAYPRTLLTVNFKHSYISNLPPFIKASKQSCLNTKKWTLLYSLLDDEPSSGYLGGLAILGLGVGVGVFWGSA